MSLMTGASLAALILATPAAAQTAPVAGQGENMGDIVITATKQQDSLRHVPISVTAISQLGLERAGSRTALDLARTVPALTIQRNGADFSPTIAIRGIYSAAGSPTTGIYLDDIALNKRQLSGVAGNGSSIPQLFDLERVEVLRGPQGTLYGGSSVGGTIRFITPTPSLTDYSGYARSEISTTQGGGMSYESGGAVGGPIVTDKLGFRASFWGSHTGGYIDHHDVFTSAKYGNDGNSGSSYAGRISLLWEPTPNLRITPAFYQSHDHQDDVDTYWLKIAPATTAAVTRAATAAFPTAYTYPSHTYSNYQSFGPFQSGNPYRSPRDSYLTLPSLTVDWDVAGINVKSVSAFVQDITNGVIDEGGFSGEARNLQAGVGFVSELPNFERKFNYRNVRTGFSQELRLSSAKPGAFINWIAGVYYMSSKVKGSTAIYEDLDQLSAVLRGSNAAAVYGAPMLPGDLAGGGSQTLDDKSIAGFAEVYLQITSKLKLTGGVRVERDTLDYTAVNLGTSLSGYVTPTVANSGLSNGHQAETASSPKVNLSYQIDDRNMIYAGATKGFRPGGVNRTVSLVSCASGLLVYGGPPPATYGSDSVWSYEAGAKLGIRKYLSMNASAFYIDWSNPQIGQTFPGCSAAFTANAGHAVSKGFDLQAQLHPTTALTLNLAVGYTNAKYTEQVVGPTPVAGATQAILTNKGDPLPVAPWQYNVGAQYDFRVAEHASYIRFDYQYASKYYRTTGPGTVSYAPDVRQADATHFATARVGTTFDGVEISAFMNNVFDSKDILSLTGGRGTCRNTACTSYAINEPQYIASSYPPRTIGLTGSTRF